MPTALDHDISQPWHSYSARERSGLPDQFVPVSPARGTGQLEHSMQRFGAQSRHGEPEAAFVFGEDDAGRVAPAFTFHLPPPSSSQPTTPTTALVDTLEDPRSDTIYAYPGLTDCENQLYFHYFMWTVQFGTTGENGDANAPLNADGLGSRTQSNQNIVFPPAPTPDDLIVVAKTLLVLRLPVHLDDVPQPNARRAALSANNGKKVRQRSSTNTVECETCKAEGRTSWHRPGPRHYDRHLKTHMPELVACILCGHTIGGRSDQPKRHRREGHCVAFNALKEHGPGLVRVWATVWNVLEHPQWGNGEDIEL